MTWRPQRRIALAAALVILAAVVPALGRETVQVPAGLTAERNPDYQSTIPLLTTPWLARHESGGIVYFLYTTAARIERFDLTSGSWLADIALLETPTALWADADGLYVSFGRRTSRFALDGTGEAHLRNTSVDATSSTSTLPTIS